MNNNSTNQFILISRVSDSLEDLASTYSPTNKSSSTTAPNTKSKFTSSVVPKIALADYLERMLTIGRLSEEAIVAAYIYIKRFSQLGKYKVSKFEIHRYISYYK